VLHDYRCLFILTGILARLEFIYQNTNKLLLNCSKIIEKLLTLYHLKSDKLCYMTIAVKV